jgi:hypothetical protein
MSTIDYTANLSQIITTAGDAIKPPNMQVKTYLR